MQYCNIAAMYCNILRYIAASLSASELHLMFCAMQEPAVLSSLLHAIGIQKSYKMNASGDVTMQCATDPTFRGQGTLATGAALLSTDCLCMHVSDCPEPTFVREYQGCQLCL